jgi:hypothetical protein
MRSGLPYPYSLLRGATRGYSHFRNSPLRIDKTVCLKRSPPQEPIRAPRIGLVRKTTLFRQGPLPHLEASPPRWRGFFLELLAYTVRRRRLSSITRAPCRKVMGVPASRCVRMGVRGLSSSIC